MNLRIRARLAANPLIVDGAIALGLTALSVVALLAGAQDAGGRDPLSMALLLMETLPLVFRRRWPIPVLAVTLTATLLHAWLAPATLNESLGSLVALFTVAERYERRVSVPAAIAFAVGYGSLIALRAGLPAGLTSLIQTLLVVGVAWALGDWAQTRHRYAAAIEEGVRLRDAEREDRSRRAVQDERERIARELHDVVTHHVSVIVIQAGAGLTAFERHPEQARTALEAIDRISRQALIDMRRMLGMLGDEPIAGADPSRAPMPGLGRLGELIEGVRAAGLPVELSIEGMRRELDAGVELSAYRIVQEALTNTLKHAQGARARVTLVYRADALEIEVTDQGSTGPRDLVDGSDGGMGLIGMRERTALFGGDFDAGRIPGGFRIRARLPVASGSVAGP